VTERQARARAELVQEVRRGPVLLGRAEVVVVCLGDDGRPRRMPAAVRAALGAMGPAPERA
jgi:acyl-CoA thioesterase FadM